MEGHILRDWTPLEQIVEEFPYGLRFAYQDLALESILERKGILVPIFLTPVSDKKNVVVSGHKRLQYARKKDLREVPSYLILEKLTKKELFLISLYSNWNQNFSDLDRMEAIRKAEKNFHFTSEEVLSEVLPALGLPAAKGILEEYRETAGLVSEIHRLIFENKLPFRGAATLKVFSPAEQTLLAQAIFSKVHLTTNQLIQTVEWLSDLKRSEKTPLDQITRKELIQKALQGNSEDLRAKGEKVFSALRNLRFPRIAEEEERFLTVKRKFEQIKEIRLERPQGFELPGILLHAHLKNREGFKRVISFLEVHRSLMDPWL